jgi:hypothetical protein
MLGLNSSSNKYQKARTGAEIAKQVIKRSYGVELLANSKAANISKKI